MTATPFDLDAPLGQRRAIIQRDGDGVEMLEAAWDLRTGPNSDRPFTLVRAAGWTFPIHRCLSQRPSSAYAVAAGHTASRSPMATASISPVYCRPGESRLAQILRDPDRHGE